MAQFPRRPQKSSIGLKSALQINISSRDELNEGLIESQRFAAKKNRPRLFRFATCGGNPPGSLKRQGVQV